MFPFFSRMFPGTNLQDLNLDWIIRRVMELSKGIIAPWINAQNQHWMVYDTAAETFVDSGVSAAGEGTGPQGEPGKSPVIGSNGNWYTWDTTTQAYTDTGTHAEGPEGPEGAEGPQGPRGPGANRNLLDNWYFVGGGSQQGGCQFPINQRGLTIYTGANYGIDRWTSESNITVNVKPSCIGFVGNGLNLEQPIENGALKSIIGKQITGTVLYADGTIETGSRLWPAAPESSGWNYAVLFSGTKMAFIAGTSIDINNNISGNVFLQSKQATEIEIVAVKLELGSEQTLAHKESSQWVLNEIPNYGQELAKCQRYYRAIKSSNNTIAVCLGNVIPYSDDSILSMDIELAGVPTVRITGLKLSDGFYWNGIDATYTTGYTLGRLDFFINSPGVTAGKAYRVLAEGGTSVEIEVP